MKKFYEYKLRAECINDIYEFIGKSTNIISNVNIISESLFPDCELEFDSEYTLEQIKCNILSTIIDSHVMKETISYINNYTGIYNSNSNLNKEYSISLKDIKKPLKNAYKGWSRDEDRFLKKEVKIAIHQIASNHKRSFGAIVSRINQKELLYND